MRNYILAGVLLIALAGLTGATVLKVELPADLTADDVLNPTAEVSTRLDKLVREETAKHPAYAAFSRSNIT